MNYDLDHMTPYKDIEGVLWTRVTCSFCDNKFEAQGRPAIIATEHPDWAFKEDYVACPDCYRLLKNPSDELGSLAYHIKKEAIG